MASNKIQLKLGYTVGEINAEDDSHYLDKSFIHKSQIDLLLDLDNNSSILLGRTGAGKTAILKKIGSQKNLHKRHIDLEALFFQHISNSKTFDFFIGIGANLDIIFGLLWKHILLIEVIKLYFETQSKFDNAIGRLFSGRERRLKTYLDKWETDF